MDSGFGEVTPMMAQQLAKDGALIVPATVAAPLQLAEVQWTWRRWYTYVLTAALAGLVAYVISRLDDPGALKAVGLALCGLIGLGQLLYMAGAVVTDLARLAAAVRAGKSPEGGA